MIQRYLILDATHRVSVTSEDGGHIGIGAADAEYARVGATNRTAPIGALGPNIGEITNVDVAVARHGQFNRRGKSAGCVVVGSPA